MKHEGRFRDAEGHAEGYVAGAMEVTERLHDFAAWLDGRSDEAWRRPGSYDDYNPGMRSAYDAALEYLEEMFRLPEQWEMRGPR